MKLLSHILLFPFLLFLQQSNSQAQSFCATFTQLEELQKLSVSKLEKLQKSEIAYQKYYSQSLTSIKKMTTTLPVVIHIFNQDEIGQIEDEQVYNALNYLNLAFNNLEPYNPNTGYTTGIEFCLAQTAPNGLGTSGINRIESSLATEGNTALEITEGTAWNPNQYINIYVLPILCGFSGDNCGDYAGYATFPSFHGLTIDGIFIDTDVFGTSPSATASLVHEAGHYLGLYHTFEGGCLNENCLQQGDYICDTPPDASILFSNCANPQNSCNTDVQLSDENNPFVTDQADAVENYMDYGFSCYSAFTEGQIIRMNYIVENIRNSLLNSPACEISCLELISASFAIADDTIYIGESIFFENLSENADSIVWSIDGEEVSQEEDLTYLFQEIGTYQVSLEVFNATTECSDTYVQTITVLCYAQANFTISQSEVFIGEMLTITNNSENAVNYSWTVNGAVFTSEAQPVFNFEEVGFYQIALTVQDFDFTCSSSFTQSVQVLCPLFLEIEGDDNIYEEGDTIQLFLAENTSDAGNLVWKLNGICIQEGGDTLEYIVDDTVVLMFEAELSNDTCVVSDYVRFVIQGECSLENTFVTEYDDDILGRWYRLSYVENGQFYIQSPNRKDLIKLDKFGNVLNAIRAEGDELLFDFVVTSQERIVAAYKTNLFTGVIRIVEYDFNLNVISTKIDTNTGNFITGLQLLQNGKIGINYSTGHTEKLIEYSEENTNFNTVIHFLEENSLKQIIDLSNGKKILRTENYLIGYNQDNTISWTKNFPDNSIGINSIRKGYLVPDNEGNFYITYSVSTSSDPLNPEQAVFLLKISDTGEVIWRKYFSNRVAPVVSVSPSGNIAVAMAYFESFSPWGNNERHQEVFFLSSEGDLLNQLSYEYEIGSILAMPDSTWTMSPGYSNSFYDNLLIKTDNLGFASCGIINREILPFITFSPGNLLDASAEQLSETSSLIFSPSDITLSDFTVTKNELCSTSFADAVVDSLAYEVCSLSGNLTITVCNEGVNILPDSMYISIYEAHPEIMNMPVLMTFPIEEIIRADSCRSFSIEIAPPPTEQFFILLNHNAQSLETINLEEAIINSAVSECHYENNLDSLTVEFYSVPDYPIETDTITLCGEISTSLSAEIVGLNYLWSNESEISNITVNENGFYSVTITDECDISKIHNWEVSFNSTAFDLDLGLDTIICNGSIYGLNAPIGMQSYLWQDGSTNSSYTAWQTGEYWVEVTDYCGEIMADTINIFINEAAIIDLPEFINVCLDSIEIDVTNDVFSSYQWTPSIGMNCDTCSVVSVLPDETTTYFLIASNEEGCFVGNSIQVLVSDLISTLPADTIFCIEDNNTLSVNPEYTQYTWLPNEAVSCPDCSTTEIISILPQTISVEITDDLGCTLVDSVFVDFATINIESEYLEPTCNGFSDGQIILSSDANLEYSLDEQNWQPNNLFSNLTAGNYIIFARNENGCIFEHEAFLDEPEPLEIEGSSDATIAQGDTVTLSVMGSGGTLDYIYTWTPSNNLNCSDCSEVIASPEENISYIIAINDVNGCEALDTIFVGVSNDKSIFIPNAFSPNGDNFNDRFTVFCSLNVAKVDFLRIYDKWGELVFSNFDFLPNDESLGWDGTHRGERLVSQVLVYVTQITFADGSTQTFSGDVSMLR